MNIHLRYLLIGSSLVLGACEFEDDLELEQPEAGQPTEHETPDEIDSGNEAELRTVVGLDPQCASVHAPIIARTSSHAAPCSFHGFAPFTSEWTATRMFEDGSPMLAPYNWYWGGASNPLQLYCRYDYIGNDVDPYNDYAALLAAMRASRSGVEGSTAATDCPVIAPMTDQGLDTADAREALHEGFMANIHAVSSADLANFDLHPTRLVLLDTVAEGEAPYNEHGLQLESLIADIACPGDPEACLDSIRHVLVTPRVPDDNYATADWDGGNVGYMHEFSMGVLAALLDWHSENYLLNPADQERLVISAAIGADPGHPIASDPTLAPAQSAIHALQAAYCMGAVVYAAAGNVRENSCEETGMLAPASYEDFPVPSQLQCITWGYPALHSSYTFDSTSPLIHAVGGLDGHDQPIANHRRNAHPGLHATSSDAISSDGTVTITGTSVGTAVAAATHFLLWSLEPNITPKEVATVLYDTGYVTGEDADSGVYQNEDIRRLSVCHAVDWLIDDLICGSGAPDADANLDVYLTEIEDAIDVADFNELLVPAGSPIEGDEATCTPSSDPFIKPQPERPACSHCNVDLAASGNNHMLNMSIAMQSWTVNQTVTAAKLYTYNAVGVPTVFDLTAVVPSINAALPTNVIQVSITTPTPASAALEFVYSDGITFTTQSNPIPLL
jgi:hypothetical protein